MSDIDFVEEHEEPLADEISQQRGPDETTDEPATDETAEADQETDEPEDKTDETDESDDGEEKAESADSDAEPDQDDDTEPKKLSRNQRRNQRLRELSVRAEEQDQEISDLKAKLALYEDRKPVEPPKEEDFAGDWEAYERAQRQHEIETSVQKVTDNQRKEALQSELEAAEKAKFREQAQIFDEREQAAAQEMPDYTEKVTGLEQRLRAANVGLPNHSLQEIMADPNGPQLLYVAASDDKFLGELMSADPYSVVRAVAARSAVLSNHKPKKQTTAPPPVKPLKGGGQATQKDPSEMSIEEYRAWRKEPPPGQI